MKNIWHKLKLKKKSDPYFQKDEQGRDIYYPWGYVGDAYYISRTQKTILKVSPSISGLIYFVASFFLGVTYHSDYSVYSIGIATLNVYILITLVFLYFYTKRMEPVKLLTPSTQAFNKNPNSIKVFSIGIIMQIFFLTKGFLENPSDPLLKLSAFFVLVLHPLLIWFLWRRRGYIFQTSSVQDHP